MIPKPINHTSDNRDYTVFAGGLELMDDREFNWAKVHYENRAKKWPNSHHYLTMRDLVRAEAERREYDRCEEAA